jgi:hypothetical protein
MSAGKFWITGRSRGEESGPAAMNETIEVAGLLTALDRCDRCGARAYVRVLLPSGLELMFCAHHSRQHASALAEIAVEIQDETERLARIAA